MILLPKIGIFQAAHSLVGGQMTWYEGGTPEEKVLYHDGQTPPTDAAISAEIVRLQAIEDAQLYARHRKDEYDELNQFELMTDDAANSTTTHAAAVAVIKTKWPKDNSGPIE